MWFKLEHSDLDFVATAPFKFHNEGLIEASPEEVFALLADTEGWPRWFSEFREAHWLTEPPYGVGSKRLAKLKALSARERMIAWDPGSRWAFSIEELTVPLLRRGIEDYVLEPAGDGRTFLRWTMYYQPNLLLRVLHLAIRPVFARMFRKGMRELTEHMRVRREPKSTSAA